MIAIIDYGMGNLRSVQKGFERVGFEAVVTRDLGQIQSARGVVQRAGDGRAAGRRTWRSAAGARGRMAGQRRQPGRQRQKPGGLVVRRRAYYPISTSAYKRKAGTIR